jgi:hypothetical protein
LKIYDSYVNGWNAEPSLIKKGDKMSGQTIKIIDLSGEPAEDTTPRDIPPEVESINIYNLYKAYFKRRLTKFVDYWLSRVSDESTADGGTTVSKCIRAMYKESSSREDFIIRLIDLYTDIENHNKTTNLMRAYFPKKYGLKLVGWDDPK